MDQTSMPPDRSGRTGSGGRVRAPSATRGQGGDLVGGLDGGGGRQRTSESALLAQVEAGGATPADAGVQAGHGGSFDSQWVAVARRKADRGAAGAGASAEESGLETATTSSSGVTV